MKMPTNKFMLITVLVIAFAVTSCGEYNEFDNKQVVDNSFSGNVTITSGGDDPAGDFTGSGDSGTYSFAWINSAATADVNFDITTEQGGSVQLIINDKKGDEVLNERLPADGEDTFSGVTAEGKSGTWLVTFIFTNVDGDGSFSMSPGD